MDGLGRRLLLGVRALVAAAVAGLTLFHLRLFVDDMVGGELADPGLVLRWLLSGALVVAVAALALSGASLRGTRGIAASLLVVMLHVPAMAPDPSTEAAPRPAEALATMLQTAAALAGVLLVLVSGFGRRSVDTVRAVALASIAATPGPHFALACVQPFAPRPPPRVS